MHLEHISLEHAKSTAAKVCQRVTRQAGNAVLSCEFIENYMQLSWKIINAVPDLLE